MTVQLKELRTVAVITWDTAVVKGKEATIEAEGQEKRIVVNDGESNLFYPFDVSTKVTTNVVVRGSHGGEDKGTIEVDTEAWGDQ